MPPGLLLCLKKEQPAPGDVKGGVHPDTMLCDVVSKPLVEHPRAGGVGEPAVHDDVEPGVHRHAHGGVGAAVSGHQLVSPVPLLRDGLELLH